MHAEELTLRSRSAGLGKNVPPVAAATEPPKNSRPTYPAEAGGGVSPPVATANRLRVAPMQM